MLTFQVSQQKLITLKSKELFFLAGVLGSNRLLGVEDPFQGFLAEELTTEWDLVKASLMDKGYLNQVENGGELAIPPTVFSRVAIAGLSSRACRYRYTKDGAQFEGYLHCTNERVVELSPSEESDDEYRLSDLGDVTAACDTLTDKMGWREQAQEEVPALMFSQKKFREIYDLAGKEDIQSLASTFAEASGDPEGSLKLAETLNSRISDGELQLLVWNGREWEAQRAAFAVSESMSWLFRMSSGGNGDWLVATLTTRAQFVDMLLNWLRQSAGEEER